MTKDERLYARFDIGMDEHPKIMLLSDTAFRALFESTLYARRQLTDGFLAEGIVVRKWGTEAAAELTCNHPERPSWTRVEGGWQIRDYAEHQITRADIEAKREAGRKGGLAKASKTVAGASDVPEQKASKPLADGLANGYETLAKTETETETSTSNEVERTPRKRGSRLDSNWYPSEQSKAKAREDAPHVDFASEHKVFIDYWIAQPGQKGVKTDWEATWRNWMRRKESDLKSRTTRQTPTERAVTTLTLATDIEMGAIGA